MPYTGSQIARITDTVLAAYTCDEVRRAVRTCLDWDFDALVADKAFEIQVDELVRWADRDYKALDLVRCLAKQKPGNVALQALAGEMGGWPHLDVSDPAYHGAGSKQPPPVQDVVVAEVGESAAQVVVGKNNRVVQIGTVQAPFWAVLLVAVAALLVVVLAGVAANAMRQAGAGIEDTAAILAATHTPMPSATPVPTVTPTPLPFAPAAEGETLIVIAKFHNTAEVDVEAHNKIRRAINRELAKLDSSAIRVEVDFNTELTPDQRAQAIALGKRYDGSMVIWGEDTGAEVYVSFLNLRQPELTAAEVNIAENERVAIANPSAYAQFVTEDLPEQLTYLALFAVGQSRYLAAEYSEARTIIQTAVDTIDLTSQQPAGIADAYFRLGWLYEQPPAAPEKIIAYYTQAIDLGMNRAVVYNNRGVAYVDRGEIETAITDYDRALALDPTYSLAWANRGIAKRMQGDLEAAVADYTEAIRLAPNMTGPYYNRGKAYASMNLPENAIRDYDRAIELEPTFAGAFYHRGLVRQGLGDLAGAIADYSQAIHLFPDIAQGHYQRGLAHELNGDLGAAVADFSAAIDLSPLYFDAYYERGSIYERQDELAQALENYTQVIALEPNAAKAYYRRGRTYYDLGDLDAAIADFTAAIALEPDIAASYYQRSICFFEQDELALATADFIRASSLQAREYDLTTPTPAVTP